MNDKYCLTIRKHYEEMDNAESFGRVGGCARRILTAICLRESSEISFVKANTLIVPAIGFYYSLIHMGAAMLYLECTTPVKNLTSVNYSKLRSLIQSKLIKRKLISPDYLNILDRFQAMKGHIDSTTLRTVTYNEYIERGRGSQMYQDTGEAFYTALSLIQRLGIEIERVSDFICPVENISTIITNQIHNEHFLMHLSKDDRKRILNFLILWRLVEC